MNDDGSYAAHVRWRGVIHLAASEENGSLALFFNQQYVDILCTTTYTRSQDVRHVGDPVSCLECLSQRG